MRPTPGRCFDLGGRVQGAGGKGASNWAAAAGCRVPCVQVGPGREPFPRSPGFSVGAFPGERRRKDRGGPSSFRDAGTVAHGDEGEVGGRAGPGLPRLSGVGRRPCGVANSPP